MRLVIIFSLLLMPLLVKADEIDRLIKLTGINEMIKKSYSECLAGSSQLLSDELKLEDQSKIFGIGPGQKGWDELKSIYKEFYSVACKFLSVEEAKKIWRNSYKNNLSKSEINKLIKFYSSPLGKKVVNLDLQANAKLQEAISKRYAMQAYKAQRIFEQRIYSLKKRLGK